MALYHGLAIYTAHDFLLAVHHHPWISQSHTLHSLHQSYLFFASDLAFSSPDLPFSAYFLAFQASYLNFSASDLAFLTSDLTFLASKYAF